MSRVKHFVLLIVLSIAVSVISPREGHAFDAEDLVRDLIDDGVSSIIRNERRKVRKRRNRDTRKNQQRKRYNAAAANEPRMRRSEVVEIQHGLNELGFNVGQVDGAIGRTTRKRIRSYQSSIGVAATGYLTASQIRQLKSVSAGAFANNSGQSTGEFEASTQDEKPAELSQSQVVLLQRSLNTLGYNAGSVDGKLGRGTANALSRFLKDNGKDPSITSPSAAVRFASKQAGLTGDTLASGNTQASNENGEIDLLKALQPTKPVSESEIQSSSGSSSGAFDSASYSNKAKSPNFDLLLELSRRALYHQPQFLESDRVTVKWIEKQFPSYKYRAGKPLATENTVKFYDGTSFQRGDAIKSLREQIAASATASALKFISSRQIVMFPGKFIPGKGIPIHFAGNNNYKTATAEMSKLDIYLGHLGTDANFYFDEPVDIGYLPTDEAGARKFAELIQKNKYNRLRMQFYVNVKSIGQTLEDGYGGKEFIADASFDAIEIVMAGRKNTEVTKDRSLFVWDLTKQSEENGPNRLSGGALAKFFGLPVSKGTLVKRTNFFFGAPQGFGIDVEQSKSGWARLQYLAQLGYNNGLLNDDELLVDYAKRTLKLSDLRKISRGKALFKTNVTGPSGLRAFSEFEAREVLDDLRTNYSEKILSKTPEFPISSVEIIQAKLGKYDFDKQEFEIEWSNGHGQRGDKGAYRFLSSGFKNQKLLKQQVLPSFKDFPTHVSVPQKDARALSTYLEKKKGNRGNRYIYFAMYGSIERPIINTGRLTYNVPVSRAALFADPDLKQLVREFRVSTGWENSGVAKSDHPIPISQDTSWMWVAKQSPDKFDSKEYILEALKRRRAAERDNKGKGLYGEKYLPRLVRESLKNADENDIAAFTEQYRDIVNNADFSKIRFNGGVRFTKKPDGQFEINLHESFIRSHIQNATPLRKARSESFTSAFGHYQITEEGEMPVILAAMQEKNWFGTAMPASTSKKNYDIAPGYVDLVVVGMEILKGDYDRPIMVVGVKPDKISLLNADGSEIVKLVGDKQEANESVGVALSEQNILGVQLGMSLEEGKKAILSEIGTDFQWQTLKGSKPSLDTGLSYSIGDSNDRYKQHVAMYSGKGSRQQNVIAVSNVQVFDTKIDTEIVLNALKEKYGEPTGGRFYHSGSGEYTWVFDKDSRNRVEDNLSDSGCRISPQRSFYLDKRTGVVQYDRALGPIVQLAELNSSCGIVLNSYFDDEGIALILVDTNAALDLKNEILVEAAEAEEAKKVKAPKIKF